MLHPMMGVSHGDYLMVWERLFPYPGASLCCLNGSDVHQPFCWHWTEASKGVGEEDRVVSWTGTDPGVCWCCRDPPLLPPCCLPSTRFLPILPHHFICSISVLGTLQHTQSFTVNQGPLQLLSLPPSPVNRFGVGPSHRGIGRNGCCCALAGDNLERLGIDATGLVQWRTHLYRPPLNPPLGFRRAWNDPL